MSPTLLAIVECEAAWIATDRMVEVHHFRNIERSCDVRRSPLVGFLAVLQGARCMKGPLV